MDFTAIEKQLTSLTDLLGFAPDPQQVQAIQLCVDIVKRLVSVTGAAGTGKTTIIRAVYHMLKDAGFAVVLCAPTGKAAKRITQATGIPAMTVHRLLEYTHPGEPDEATGKVFNSSFPRRTAANPIEFDVVLCDEYSMINVELHRNLINALPRGGVLRMFGDNNQLPPIETDKRLLNEPSSFLTMLDKFPAVILDVVHRQGADSGILGNLQQILRGRIPRANDQWHMHFTDGPVDVVKDLIFSALDHEVDFCAIENQIITPTNKTWVGTVKLNPLIQGLFRDAMDPCLYIPRHKWIEGMDGKKGGVIRVYQGDKIIITSNNYDLAVFNGESGIITEIGADGEVVIDFGDREQTIPPSMDVLNRYGRMVSVDPRRDIDLGYVITTHKSQGSEYKNVIYLMNKSCSWMLNRRNLYTACSRAKENLHLVTDQNSISLAVNKQG